MISLRSGMISPIRTFIYSIESLILPINKLIPGGKMIYKTLENETAENIHAAFVEAFSDYAVKLDLPFVNFMRMMTRRGVDFSKSVGAYDGEKLVGIQLNGIGEWEGNKTAYDSGTGIAKEYRGKGIGGELFKNCLPVFSANGITHYLLEVLRENTPAFNLYKKSGFAITREFECYQIDNIEDKSLKSGFEIEKVDLLSFNEIDGFKNFRDSWQNSNYSIKRVPEHFEYFVAKDKNKILGYIIIEPLRGDVPQLAVAGDYRRKGIATDLVKAAFAATENPLKFINIDSRDKMTIKLLQSLGAKDIAGQYEMINKL